MNYEQKLVNDLRNNEKIVQVIDADDLRREYEARKGNIKKILGYSASFVDSVAATKLLVELGYKPEQLVIKQYANGKNYVIFKGYAGNRSIFRGTRYLTSNPQIIRIAVGPKGILKSAKSGFVLSFVLSVSIEIFDYLINDNATLSKLLGTMSTDLIKIGIGAIAGAAAGVAVGSAAVIGTIAAAPLIAAIVVGVIVGRILDEIDSRYGATHALIKAYKRIGVSLDEIAYEFNRNLNWLERHPHLVPCLIGPCSGIRGY